MITAELQRLISCVYLLLKLITQQKFKKKEAGVNIFSQLTAGGELL